MKKLFFLLVMAMSFTTMAHGVMPNDPGKGFNYKKHYRKQHRVIFFNRLFNRNGCY